MTSRNVSVIAALPVTALLIFAPAPAHAEDTLLRCTDKVATHAQMKLTVATNTVTYRYVQSDGTTPWSKGSIVVVVPARITPDTVFWAVPADGAQDSPTAEFTLDRKSNHLTQTDIGNISETRIVFWELDCH
jgi:hypothetical protein